MSILLRKSILIPLTQFVSALITGAMELLIGETQGYAIDATSINNRSYIGGPDGGEVACRDTSTPANDLSNVPLDSSNLTQSGTSAKMVNWNSDPYLRWTPHNLLLQSQTFGTTWSPATGSVSSNTATAPDSSLTADQFTQGATGELSQSVTMLADVQYTLTFYVKAGTATWLRLVQGEVTDSNTGWFNVSTGAAGSVANGGTTTGAAISAVDAGNGWYRVSLTGIPSNGVATTPAVSISCVTADAGIVRDTGKTILLWGGQWNRGPIATPYLVTTTTARVGIPQGYDVANSKFGMLIEPAATNLLTWSEAFGDADWGAFNLTVGADAVAAPDGSLTADSLTDDASLGHNMGEAFTGTVDTYTGSVFLKMGTQRYVSLKMNEDTGPDDRWAAATFDLQSGQVTKTGNGGAVGTVNSASVVSVGNGWYRCIVTITWTIAVDSFTIYPVDSATPTYGTYGDVNYSGSGTTFYAWGAQIELGSVATSYVPTVAATATRAQDDIRCLTSTIPYSATLGTIYFDILMADIGDDYLQITDGTANEHISWYADINAVQNDVIDGGVIQVAFATGTFVANSRMQISSAWKLNDFDLSFNGEVPVTDSSGTLPTVTQFLIGSDNSAIVTLPKYFYRLVYTPRQVETDNSNLKTWRYNYP